MARRILSLVSLLALLASLAGIVQARPTEPPQLEPPMPAPEDADRFEATGLPEPSRPAPSPGAVPATITPDPIIQSMIDQVISTTVYSYTGDLSGEWPVLIGGEPYTITTRHTYSGEPIGKATQFAGEHLETLDLDVEYHVWDAITNPNVIGELPGLIHPEDIFIICAHLDDMPTGPTAPGADDNASGSVAVLIAADILTQYNWGCTLRFALWTGEEQGLRGSRSYAYRSRSRHENIVGVLNLDMIGYNTMGSDPGIDLHANGTFTPTMVLAQVFSDVVGAYNLNLNPQIWPSAMGGSDQYSFWAYGFPAFLAIEDSNDFNPYYHTTQDLLEHLDVEYFTQFVRASVGTFAHMSGCLIPGGVGYADGQVTAAGSGAPIERATVTFEDAMGQTMPATTDAGGYYTRTLPVGAYTATAWAYGYLPSPVVGVAIVTDTTTTQSFSLSVSPDYVVSGTVSEAGTGIPLQALITVPGTPLAPAWSDPATGFYSLTIAAGTYTFHVTATAHHATEQAVVVDRDHTQNLSLQPYACILLVDDDRNLPNVESYYTSALDAIGADYDLWNTDGGDPLVNDLLGHRMVIWFTGRLVSGTFTSANEAIAATYLDNGGRLFLSSHEYLHRGLTPFGQDYLGIVSFTQDTKEVDAVGAAGNPIGDGLGPYTLTTPLGWASYYVRTDRVDGVQSSPFYWQGSGQNNSSNYQGSGFRTVFFGWPVELLPNLDDRAAVLGAIVEWFGRCGPEGNLVGQVTDAASGAPLEAVTVTVEPGGFQTTSDPVGYYSMTLPAGPYDVTAQRDGYVSQTASLTITAGLTTTQDFALEPPPACEPVTATDFAWTPLTPTAGLAVTFTGTASGTEPISYTWSPGDGAISEGAAISHTYDLPGTYTVVMTATNGCGQGVATHTITVAPAYKVYLPLVLRGG